MTMTADTALEQLGNCDQLFVGLVILSAERRLDLKPIEVARRVGVHDSIISLWAQDRRPLPHGRIDQLATALEMTPLALLAEAHIERGGYSRPAYERLSRKVGVIIAPLQPRAPDPGDVILMTHAPREQLPPSQVRLWWCNSDHGCGVPRTHHHGPLPPWAPGLLATPEDMVQNLYRRPVGRTRTLDARAVGG